jgi:hypothetical protein
MTRLLRRHADFHELARNVLEKGRQVDFLSIVRADGTPRRLPDEGDDRLMIELRVIEAVQQMNGAGPGGRQADADLAGDPGVAAGHEGSLFLMANLDELEPGGGATQRRHDAADPVAGISEDAPHAPLLRPVQEEIADLLRHEPVPS